MFKNFVDNLQDPVMIAALGFLTGVSKRGFQSYETMAVKMPKMLLNNVLTVFKKRKISNLATKEEYLSVKDCNKDLFWRKVFTDLYCDYNYEILKEIISELRPFPEKYNDKFLEYISEKFVEAETELIETKENMDINPDISDDIAIATEQQDNVADLEKKIARLEADLRRRDNKIIKMQEGYRKLSEAKDELKAEYDKLELEYEKAEQSNKLLQKVVDSNSVVNKQQEEYYKRLFSLQSILMIGIKPKNGVPFPFTYRVSSAKAVFEEKLEDVPFTDVWLKKDVYSDIQVDAIMARLETKYGSLNLTELKDEQIKTIEFEVK